MAGIVDTLTRFFRGAQRPDVQAPEEVDFEAVARANPKDPEAWLNLGSYYRVQGQPDKAVEALEQALSLRSDLVEARYMLGLAYADLSQVDKATQMFEEVARSADNRILQDYARRKLSELKMGKPAS